MTEYSCRQMMRTLSAEGMRHSSLSPRQFRLIPRTAAGHIYLCHQAGVAARPRDFTTLCGCNAETSRLFMRNGERDGLLKTVSRPAAHVAPTDNLILLMKMLNGELQRQFPVGPPKQRRLAANRILLAQTFSIQSLATMEHRFIFNSLVRRSIAAVLVLAAQRGDPVSEKWIRHSFDISLEGFRLFKNDLIDAGFVEAAGHGAIPSLQAMPALIDPFVARCRNAISTVTHTPVSDERKYPLIFNELLETTAFAAQ